MNTSRKLLLGIVVAVGALVHTACATTVSTPDPVGVPRSWVSQFDDRGVGCQDIAGTFRNKGEEYKGEDLPTQEALLSAAAFSLVLPGGTPTESVSLETDLGSETLMVTLIGASTRKVEQNLSCAQGWLVTKHSRSGHYVGEGVVEREFNQVTFLRVGAAGDLIVKVAGDAEFNSMYVIDSAVHAETWYRFQPAR